MDQLVGINFNDKTVSMPRQNLIAEEIAKLFDIKENGLHQGQEGFTLGQYLAQKFIRD